MVKSVRSRGSVFLVGIVLVSLSPVLGQPERDERVNSRWLTDRVLLVGYGETDDKVAAVKTAKGIVVIDTGYSPTLTAMYRAAIAAEFGRSDFRYVINTHSHGDHVLGNQAFKDAEIVAHRNIVEGIGAWAIEDDEIGAHVGRLRKRIERWKQVLETSDNNSDLQRMLRDWIRVFDMRCEDYETNHELTLPTITFSDELTLDMGDLEIELVYFGPGFHTDSDILVSIPEENIVFTGDVLLPMDRYYRVNSRSDLAPWISALDRIRETNRDLEQVVSNHAGILPAAVLEEFHGSLETLRDERRQKRNATEELRSMIAKLGLEKAVAEFEQQFAEIGNDDYYVWEGDLISLADELREGDQAAGALLILEMCGKLFPNAIEVFFRQGRILMAEGQRQPAIEAFQKILRLDPLDVVVVDLVHQAESGN